MSKEELDYLDSLECPLEIEVIHRTPEEIMAGKLAIEACQELFEWFLDFPGSTEIIYEAGLGNVYKKVLRVRTILESRNKDE